MLASLQMPCDHMLDGYLQWTYVPSPSGYGPSGASVPQMLKISI